MFHNIKDLKPADITKAYIMFGKGGIDRHDVDELFVM